MTSISKHVFRVLAGATRRRLVAGALGALMLGMLPLLPSGAPSKVHLETTPVAAGPWLDRLNAWRASSGLPNLIENATWSAGDQYHSRYMVLNNEVAHYEISTHPYYTAAGDTAAQNSNIEVTWTANPALFSDSQAIDWWMAAPFHAMSMMDPRLATTGFGAYRNANAPGWKGAFALDVGRGQTSAGRYPMFYPGNGATVPLRTYDGAESPNPLQACSGYTAPSGLPIFVEVGSNVATTATAHSFTGDGVALSHCVIDSRNAALGGSLKWHGGVILIPKAPLQNGVKYAAALTVNGKPYTWSFTVGATLLPPLAVTSLSPNKGPVAGGTSVTVHGAGFANGLTGVMFGNTPAASFSLVDDRTVTAVSPAHAAGAVDVTVTTAAGTTGISTGDQYSFGACLSATAAPAPASPSNVGTHVVVTGIAVGCPTPLYEFWLMYPNKTWHMVQAFGGDTWSWDTSTYAPGGYTVHIWANNAGDVQTTYETFASLTYTVLPNRCTSAALTVSGLASRAAGSPIIFNATSGGCPTPIYAYWVGDSKGRWTLKRPFASDASWTWDTKGLAPGAYYVHVWANNSGNPTTKWEAYGSKTVTLTGCASAALTPLTGSARVGVSVTFNATSTGCPSPVYEPWLQYPNGTWHLIRPFSSSSAWTWITTGFPKGKYALHIWANNLGSYYGTYQTFGTSTFTLS